MTLADFESLYQRDADPWGYRSRRYERDKYQATLDACGPGPFSCALELGASIGVFSAMLAPRCSQLTTLDGAPTAVHAAERVLHEQANVRVLLGTIPDAIPAGPVDLVVASEILYYLDPDALVATLASLSGVLSSGGRLVAVHWRPTGPDRPASAETVHAALRSLSWLEEVDDRSTDDYLLNVYERS
jgi:cyclopropane fatty-acyl-phospholipid synthase-like methyltransferase